MAVIKGKLPSWLQDGETLVSTAPKQAQDSKQNSEKAKAEKPKDNLSGDQTERSSDNS